MSPKCLAMLLLTGGAALLTGCASAERGTVTQIRAEAYAATFEATRDVLREAGFDLNRIDLRAGVITTGRKQTLGLATPWDGEQSTAFQEWEDFMNRQEREVRVTFVPVGMLAESDETGLTDVAAHRGDLEVRTFVTVFRGYRPGWRIDTTSIRQSSRAWDPDLARRGMVPGYTVPVAEDRRLAGRLLESITERASDAQP